MNDVVMVNRYKTLCALHVHSLLQALSVRRVEGSVSGHNSLVALCPLVSSQEGQ